MAKRKPEIVVISDIHLGTYGCHAEELLDYLKSIKPKILILNGDIIDIWQLSKNYFPKAHFEVIKKFIKWIASEEVDVYYLTGNHDEMLRKFSPFSLGNFHLLDKMKLQVGDKTAWVFHGDIFDASVTTSKWLAKLGSWGYDLLVVLNRVINFFLVKMGASKMSFSKKIKDNVKKAVKFVDDFEQTAIDLALAQNYDFVICGHIHKPQIKEVHIANKSIIYLNSGDWIENLTALEYYEGEWHIYQHEEKMEDLDITKLKQSASYPPVQLLATT